MENSFCPWLRMAAAVMALVQQRDSLIVESQTCPRQRNDGCEMWDDERECCGLRHSLSWEHSQYLQVEKRREEDRRKLAEIQGGYSTSVDRNDAAVRELCKTVLRR